MSGIYFHIPFCKQACHYCNFHFSTSLNLKGDVVGAMLKELHARADYLQGSEVDTIYFGGGTPSLLSGPELDSIFEEVYRSFKVNASAEITLEANPDDLSVEKLEQLAAGPVNRLSIGVQSFHEAELSWMNRAHTADESLRCILDARNSGFDNISMDLIFGIQMGSHQLWKENLRMAIELQVPHISSYALTVEQGTALGKWVEKGKEIEAKDEYVMAQFDMGVEALEQAGYGQYEISNFALPDNEAVHNSNYWKARHYLGIGPSAHSFNGSSRSMNVANNVKYLQAIRDGLIYSETENLSAATKYNEYVMTRLRTSWGVDIREISEFQDHFAGEVLKLVKKGWVDEEDGIYMLTRAGKHFADAAAMELFAEEG